MVSVSFKIPAVQLCLDVINESQQLIQPYISNDVKKCHKLDRNGNLSMIIARSLNFFFIPRKLD